MSSLIHLVYSSAERTAFTSDDLVKLLSGARANNESLDVTGMLLYTEGSFFQILEGAPEQVDALFEKISGDARHGQVVVIIREPIAARSFGAWTMGFADVTSAELDDLVGMNDFFATGSCFGELDRGRAKKLLAAFREGRWRSRVTGPKVAAHAGAMVAAPAAYVPPQVNFAFQPIVDTSEQEVIGYEAVLVGPDGSPSREAIEAIPKAARPQFDADCRAIAIRSASKLNLTSNLHLNFLAVNVDESEAAIRATVEAAELSGIEPRQIVLEVDQDTLVGDKHRFGNVIAQYRLAGVQFLIDNFGEGTSGLDLLEPYRPELIALNPNLVRGIDCNGSRQAIVRGVLQTCMDLGIDVVAKHVESAEEFDWLSSEGVALFQGSLFAVADAASLPTPSYPAVTAGAW